MKDLLVNKVQRPYTKSYIIAIIYKGIIIVCNHIMDLWKKIWGVDYHSVGKELAENAEAKILF